jgi:outer membrane protein assembly factor BamA
MDTLTSQFLARRPWPFALGAYIALLVGFLPLGAAVPAETSPQASSRSMPASVYKLISVKVTGSKHFTSEQLAAASGLPIGTIAHEEDFKKAARQLGESGAFSSIAYTFSYSSAGTRLEFQVTDAEKFVPARFSDFVWFTEDDLRKQLHDHIPLFGGELPSSGRLPDQVSDVLQALLVELAVPGVVEYTRNTGKSGKLESIDYNVAGVSIRIHNAEFPGAGPDELPLLQAAAEKLSGREYSRDYMDSFIAHSLVPIFHERGYLKAACAPAQPKVVKVQASDSPSSRQPPTFVDVTFSVTPGIPYKLARWEWSGNKAVGTEELQPLIHAKTGQPANTVQLEDDLRAVQQLYGSRGYIRAAIKVNAQFDDAAGTVAYNLAVTEDSQFHMGELEFRGIDNNLTARLRSAWKLRPGDVYDATYLQQFLPQAGKLLPTSLDWEAATHVTALSRDKTVDVDIQYTAKAPH